MGLSVHILTSGFLVTVVIFFVLTGYFFATAYSKIGQVLEQGDSKSNDLEKLDSTLNSVRVAYILAFIAAGLTLLLAVLYAGHETVIKPSEYWHLALYLITYVALVISVIYAFIALNKLYDVGISDRNGADAYLWAGVLTAVFAFIGLTATGSGRLGMNAVRSKARSRLEGVESKINEHLPAIRDRVEHVRATVDSHLPMAHAKIDEIHRSSVVPVSQSFAPSEVVRTEVTPSKVVRTEVIPSEVVRTEVFPSEVFRTEVRPEVVRTSSVLPQTYSSFIPQSVSIPTIPVSTISTPTLRRV